MTVIRATFYDESGKEIFWLTYDDKYGPRCVLTITPDGTFRIEYPEPPESKP